MNDTFTISGGSIFRVVLTGILLYVAYKILPIIVVFFLAIVIASAFEPLIQFLRGYRLSRIAGALLIYLVIFAIAGSVFYYLLPPVFDEFSSFLKDFPRIEDELIHADFLEGIPFYSVLTDHVSAVSETGFGILQSTGGGVVQFFTKVFGGVVSFILLIVVSFYLLVQEHGLVSFIQLVTPLRYEHYILELWTRSKRKLGMWLRTMFVLMAIVGTLVYISLALIGIKYSFLLGILSGVFEIVPIVGPILAAVPGIALGLLDSPTTGLMVLLVYVIIQQIENHVLVPLIMQRAIGLNPLVVMLAVIIGGKLGGVLGVLVAVPLSAVIVEIIEDFDRRRRVTP